MQRMTRARAAAANKDEPRKTATAATAATKPATRAPRVRSASATVKSTTATGPTASTTAKKTRQTAASLKRQQQIADDENNSEDEDNDDDDDNDNDENNDEINAATPDDEDEDMTEAPRPLPKATRGRPRRVVSAPLPSEPAPTKGRPGRPRKTEATPKPAPSKAAKPEPPVKATRGRPRKAAAVEAAVPEQESVTATAVPKLAETGTAASSQPQSSLKRTMMAGSAAKPVVKKTVTFQEPEKENLDPLADASIPAAGSNKPASGGTMRSRPVRKPAATARATRATPAIKSAAGGAKAATATSTSEPKAKTPLSPKKVTQMPVYTSEEDELASVDKTPVRPILKSPVKPPTRTLPPVSATPIKKTTVEELPASEVDVEHQGHVSSSDDMEVEPANSLASPAKRPPTSPFKDAMKSPAKRMEGIQLQPAKQTISEAQVASLKASLLQTPAKRPASPSKAAFHTVARTEQSQQQQSAFKSSLFNSNAKRSTSLLSAFAPKTSSAILDAPLMKPLVPAASSTTQTFSESTSTATPLSSKYDYNMESEMDADMEDDNVFQMSPTGQKFPGRLSAVLSRHNDPVLRKGTVIIKETDRDVFKLPTELQSEEQEEDEEEEEGEEEAEEEMQVDSAEAMLTDENEDEQQQEEEEQQEAVGMEQELKAEIEMEIETETVTEVEVQVEVEVEVETEPVVQNELTVRKTRTPSPKKMATGAFGLRQKDLEMNESDSEDEPSTIKQAPKIEISAPSTPTPLVGNLRQSSAPAVPFTPLAMQLSAWSSSSPDKKSGNASGAASSSSSSSSKRQQRRQSSMPATPMTTENSPAKSSFFEDEMSIRDERQINAEMVAAIEADIAAKYGQDFVFDDMLITDEDMSLAAEAHEMSLMEPADLEKVINSEGQHDDSISDASQEYGDENAVPPVTPQRGFTKTFHTVSKVPLKPADNSTPSPLKKRSASASRLKPQRPSSNLQRSNTVISYSPTKKESQQQDEWADLATPLRSSNRQSNPTLLNGAVVFVDVRTSEGSDASLIFIELLNQMGARCVKSWPWNPSSEGSNRDFASSKIGITHVVFKDGSKRTLEKVRESKGVVQCVGVSWVLDCERQDEWLDEAPYYINNSHSSSRSGPSRRKSADVQALGNLEMQPLVSPVKQMGRAAQTAPNTPMNRRDSSAWIRSPSVDEDEDVDAEIGHDDDGANTNNNSNNAGFGERESRPWGNQSFLTPVPATPAPDAIARYIAQLGPETPSGLGFDATYGDDDDEDEDEDGDVNMGAGSDYRHMLMRTCPPNKKVFFDMCERVEGAEHVRQRLMAARRKSLQFAPKVGSPLAQTWTRRK